jgi:hypothetical protein
MCWSSLSGGGPGPFCMSGDDASGARATALASWSSIASRGNTNEFVGTGATQNADVVIIIAEQESLSLCVGIHDCSNGSKSPYSRRRNGRFYLRPR